MIEVCVALWLGAILVWSIWLSKDLTKVYRRQGTLTLSESEDSEIAHERAIRESQKVYDDLLGTGRPWERAQQDQEQGPEAPKNAAGDPIPGAWGSSEETPPYLVYTEGGKRKVTYRGEMLYDQIMGGTKR